MFCGGVFALLLLLSLLSPELVLVFVLPESVVAPLSVFDEPPEAGCEFNPSSACSDAPLSFPQLPLYHTETCALSEGSVHAASQMPTALERRVVR